MQSQTPRSPDDGALPKRGPAGSNPAGGTTRAAIYLRISQDPKEDGLAVERQRQDCERLASERGWTVSKVYSDTVSAYKRQVHRPEYEAMRADFSAGRFNALVVWDLDRLTRQPRQLEDWIEAAEDSGLRLVTANGEADLTTDGGRLFARIKASVARGESERKAARQRRQNEQAAERGTLRGGRRPFGYADDRVTPHPIEAPLIRDAYAAVLNGSTLWNIAAQWNEQGVAPHGRAPQWSTPAVRALLLRERNAGRVVHRGAVVPDAVGEWEPLVDVDTFDAARRVLTDDSRRTSPGRRPKFLAGGIAVCGTCGAPMRSNRGEGVHMYRCSASGPGAGRSPLPHGNARIDAVDPSIPMAVYRALQEADDAPSGEPTPTDDLRAERAEFARQRQVAQEEQLEAGADRAHWRRVIAQLAERIDGIDSQLQEAAESRARNSALAVAREAGRFARELVAQERIASLEEAATGVGLMGAWQHYWDELTIEEQRTLIAATLDITIRAARLSARPEKVEIRDGQLVTVRKRREGLPHVQITTKARSAA